MKNIEDIAKEVDRLIVENRELKILVQALREWVKNDAKEIKQLEDKLHEYRNR